MTNVTFFHKDNLIDGTDGLNKASDHEDFES